MQTSAEHPTVIIPRLKHPNQLHKKDETSYCGRSSTAVPALLVALRHTEGGLGQSL